MRRHDERTEGRREGHGIEKRDGNGNSHRQTELCIEGACDAADEADGHEDSHEDKCSGDESCSDAVHGIHRSFVGRLIALVEFGLHRLNDNNGIVHNSSDDEHQGKECQHVEREADGIDGSQRADERHHDGHGRNERRTEALQEDINHQNDQQQGFEKRLQDTGYRGIEEVFLRLQVLDDDARRQACTDVLHLAVNRHDYLVGVRPADLVYHDVHAGVSVRLTDEVVVLRAKFHLRHIADAQDIACGQSTNDHLLVLLFLLEATAIA